LDTDDKFYIQDANNREFEVKVVDRDPVPPPAGKDRDWKTGRVTFVANLPFMNGGGNYANLPGAPLGSGNGSKLRETPTSST